MKLQSLQLYDFRNYETASVSFHPGVNLIVGENAQGKTNLLEAVFYLSTGKSFRTARNQELIRFGAEFTDLNCSLFSGGREQSLRAVLFSGRKPRQLYIGAARPGVGKTVMAVAATLDMARRGHPAVLFSLEMSRTELWLRMLSSVASVDGHRIQTRRLRADDRAKLDEAADRMRGLPLLIDDRPGLSMAQMQAKVRTLQRRAPLGLVAVDYLGLVKPPTWAPRNDRRVQVDAIAAGLKETARMFDVPLLAMAQLNRAIESRASRSPMLSDLRESGGIEQNADVAMLMHRATTTDNGEDTSELKIHMAKNRHGPTTVLDLIFRGHYSQISEGPEWGRERAS